MAIYRPTTTRPLPNIKEADKYNNMVILSGTNQEFIQSGGVFFLDYLTGTSVTIKDGDGNTIVSGLSNFALSESPIRCDNGISITGTVVIAKGFYLANIL
jgi:hypothetical protein